MRFATLGKIMIELTMGTCVSTCVFSRHFMEPGGSWWVPNTRLLRLMSVSPWDFPLSST